MKEIKVLLILLFILSYVSSYGQSYMSRKTDSDFGFETVKKLQIDKGGHVMLTDYSDYYYTECDGTIRRLNDTTFHVAAKKTLNIFGMKANHRGDVSVAVELDSTRLSNIGVLSIIYSDGTIADCCLHYDKEKFHVEIPLNKDLFNENPGKDFYFWTLNHRNRITDKMLKFKGGTGTDFVINTGGNVDFDVVIKGDSLYPVDYYNSALGTLKLEKTQK